MITNVNIADAIELLVKEKFPSEPVYRGFTPTNFQRPSTLLEQSGGEIFPNFGCGTMELRPQFTLSTFVPVDAYQQGDTTELCRRQMLLLGLFLPGYIRVKDRAPRVLDEGKMENGLDFASVTVMLSYTLDREEFEEMQQAALAECLHLNQKEDKTT